MKSNSSQEQQNLFTIAAIMAKAGQKDINQGKVKFNLGFFEVLEVKARNYSRTPQ